MFCCTFIVIVVIKSCISVVEYVHVFNLFFHHPYNLRIQIEFLHRNKSNLYQFGTIKENWKNFEIQKNPRQWKNTHTKTDFIVHLHSNGNENVGATSRQHCISTKQSQPYTTTNGSSFSPKAERGTNAGVAVAAAAEFSSSRPPICLDFVGSFGSSSTYNHRESMSVVGQTTNASSSSLNFMDYRDFNGNSPHSSYAMFAAQSDYPPPPPNGYAGYNHAYHYSNPYINPSTTNYPLAVAGDYNPNSFGMPPPQHLPQDIKIPKDR